MTVTVLLVISGYSYFNLNGEERNMSSYRLPFSSFDEIKERGEFIKKGQILPSRVLKLPRKYQSRVVAGCNQWAIPTPNGYVVFCENHDGDFECVLKFKPMINGNHEAIGSPYSGTTDWIGNHSGEDCLERINRAYLMKSLVGNSLHDDSKQLQVNIDYSINL